MRCLHFWSHSAWDVWIFSFGLWKQWRSCVNKHELWEKNFEAVTLKQEIFAFVHTVHATPFPSPLMLWFPHSLLFAPCIPALTPNSHKEECRKEAPPFIFHGRWSSIRAHTELCSLCFPPWGWVFTRFTPWSGSQLAFIPNSPFSPPQIRFLQFYTPSISL